MIRFTITIVLLAVILIFPLRLAVSSGGFFRDGVVEGLQSCKQDSDCIWAETSCCGCYEGGGEMLINKNKKFLFNLLVKDICTKQEACVGENYCHNETVFCDRTCKFGKPTYTKPLLVK